MKQRKFAARCAAVDEMACNMLDMNNFIDNEAYELDILSQRVVCAWRRMFTQFMRRAWGISSMHSLTMSQLECRLMMSEEFRNSNRDLVTDGEVCAHYDDDDESDAEPVDLLTSEEEEEDLEDDEEEYDEPAQASLKSSSTTTLL